MKKRIFLISLMVALLILTFAISISAASTNEFCTVETISGIDLTGMASDSSARVVLFDGTEYHTFPSQYIVTDAPNLTYDFGKINGTTSTYGCSSVIRIEVPNHVTNVPTKVFSYGANNNVVEVYFSDKSNLKTLAWGAFENCSSIQKVTLPPSLESIGNNCFNNCGKLSEVNFALDGKLKTLDDKTFSSCDSLKEIVLPRNLEKIGANTFYGSDNISKIVLSPKLTKVTGTEIISAVGYNVKDFLLEMYMPGDFATAEGSLASGAIFCRNNSGDLKRYVIFVTGTKAQAEAFVTKYSADTKIVDANIVAYDEAKGNNAESYLGLDAYTTDKAVNTNHVFVYGYNLCDAFYNGDHTERLNEGATDTNPCVLTECARCGITNKYVGNENTHDFVSAYAYANYFKNGVIKSTCQNEGCIYHGEGNAKVDNETLKPIFTSIQYSTKEDSKSFGIYVEYKIDQEAVASYKTITGIDLNYGVVAIAKSNTSSANPLNVDGTTSASNIIAANVTSTKLSTVKLIVAGDWAGNSAVEIYMLGYITNGTELQYVGSQTTTVEGEAVSVAATSTSTATLNVVTYANMTGEKE